MTKKNSRISRKSIASEGNTISSEAIIEKQISTKKRWVFTWNNYPSNWKDILVGIVGINRLLVGKEIGTECGTAHLQGYIELHKANRPSNFLPNHWKLAHWEGAKGDANSNWKYCTKDNDYLVIGEWEQLQEIEIEDELIKLESFYPWQRYIYTAISQKPDKRKIYWIWEETGNTGKSSFVKYLCYKNKAVLISGKANDMKYQIACMKIKPKIIIIDCPRSNLEYISYTGIEEIKNGCFSSPKYESNMCIMPIPHLLIFANEKPDKWKMSLDRWDILEINCETLDFAVNEDDVVR